MPQAPLRLLLALAAAMLPALSSPALAAAAAVGRAGYDPALGAIVVPYTGDAPTPVVGTLKPTRHYVDLGGARLASSGLQRLATGGDLTRLWVAERPNAEAVRVAFETRQAMRPTVTVDRVNRRVLIAMGPRPAAAATPAPAAPSPRPAGDRQPLAVVSPAPARLPETRFARPYFDAARQAVVLPYLGDAPTYRLMPASGALEVQVPRAALQTPGRVAHDLAGHPVLTRFEAADDGQQGALVLRLTTSRKAEAVVALDSAKRQLLIFPQVASLRAEAGPLRTVLGRFGFDAHLAALVVPYYGQAPSYAVEPVGDRHVAVDFLGAAIEPTGVQFEVVPEMPLLSFWLAAPAEAPRVVRLSVVLPYGGHLQVLDDAPNRRLLLRPQLGPEPAPPAPEAPATP